MANEVTLSLNVAVANGNHNETFSASGLRFNQAAQGVHAQIVSVTTNAATLSKGAISSAGYAGFRNLSTATSGTAYVAIGSYDGTNIQEFCKLGRGAAAVVPLVPTITLAAKGYGTTGKIRYVVFEE
jgi:thiamine monophosphate synthase